MARRYLIEWHERKRIKGSPKTKPKFMRLRRVARWPDRSLMTFHTREEAEEEAALLDIKGEPVVKGFETSRKD